MRKYKVVHEKDYTDFSDYGVRFNETKPFYKTPISKALTAASVLYVLLPTTTYAADVDGTFGNVHEAVMRAFDAGVVIIVIFAGAAWGLGHRTKALEILIGVCCGYVLARHAVDVRDFLRTI